MSWSYNKEKPWLSGLMKKADTERWVMLKSGGPGTLYYAGGNKWTPMRSQAKLLDGEERAALAQYKGDGHWFEFVG